MIIEQQPKQDTTDVLTPAVQSAEEKPKKPDPRIIEQVILPDGSQLPVKGEIRIEILNELVKAYAYRKDKSLTAKDFTVIRNSNIYPAIRYFNNPGGALAQSGWTIGSEEKCLELTGEKVTHYSLKKLDKVCVETQTKSNNLSPEAIWEEINSRKKAKDSWGTNTKKTPEMESEDAEKARKKLQFNVGKTIVTHSVYRHIEWLTDNACKLLLDNLDNPKNIPFHLIVGCSSKDPLIGERINEFLIDSVTTFLETFFNEHWEKIASEKYLELRMLYSEHVLPIEKTDLLQDIRQHFNIPLTSVPEL